MSLLTGFLGSGKTTLLNRLLKSPELRDTAVLINEFGAIPIDHLLVRESSENLTVLANGCICCSVAGDMVSALRELYYKRASGEIPSFTRVLIETTGLADPAPILHTLIEMPLVAARYTLSGVITTIDAVHGQAQLDAHFEAVKQIAVADRIVITKTDLVSAESLASLRARVVALNPAAAIFEAGLAPIDALALVEAGLYRVNQRPAVVAEWLRAERYRPVPPGSASISTTSFGTTVAARHAHDARINAFTLQYAAPLEWQAVLDALEVLIAVRGDQLLRFKAIVDTKEDANPRVLHAVQHSIYPWASLSAWPPEIPKASQFVFITRDLAPAFIRDTFDQYLSARALDSAELSPNLSEPHMLPHASIPSTPLSAHHGH